MGTNIDYSAVAHETIYQRITGGPGSIDLREASRGWESVAAKLRDLHGAVEQAIRGIGAAQQGAAADAATDATMALMPWLEDSARMAVAMAARIAHQADHFGHTHGNMPPPVPVPEVSFSQDPLKWMGQHAVEWLPGIQTEHEQAEVAAQQAEEHARYLMTNYQNASNVNLAIGQNFGTAPTVVADVSDSALGGAGISGASAGASAGGSGTHAVPYGGSAPAAAHSAPAVAGHAASVAPAGTAPQIASGTHHPSAASPQLAGGYPSSDGQSTNGSGQTRPAAAAAFGSPPIQAGSPTNPGYRPRGGSGISGVTVGRGGGFGPRPSAVLGETHAPTGSAGQAGAEHAGAGRAARGGGGGWAGLPLGATGGSGRDSDAEHRRPSYLIEPDTSAIVGDLPQVAPPVIGEG